ncbi:hypothetical protein [Oryzomonas rubra]|uniref:Uncharacterized protein n=1 Tax=Oryzomonas rubra TaxID=2509454 RepID=A0A5A9X6S0_9BACT|nr:hypothetical protein [Oryzomonas rubra]KAA0888065.1 hypothetical protein ET418_16835 [Oryzomonas rubra]
MYELEIRDCPDCGVEPGAVHRAGCDIARCPECGRQKISCGHSSSVHAVWDGEYPGIMDCRRLGLWAIFDGEHFTPCGADEPGAIEDLNRLYREYVWNKSTQQFELPK